MTLPRRRREPRHGLTAGDWSCRGIGRGMTDAVAGIRLKAVGAKR